MAIDHTAPDRQGACLFTQVPPDRAVVEALCVSRQVVEDALGCHDDQLGLGPADRNRQAARIEQERAGVAQVGRVALGCAVDDYLALVALEALDCVDAIDYTRVSRALV